MIATTLSTSTTSASTSTKLRVVLVTNAGTWGIAQEEALVTNLELHGVEVVRTLRGDDMDPRKVDLSGIDALMMTLDNTSHSQATVARMAARKHNCRFIPIPRHASAWPQDFRSPQLLAQNAERHTVADKDLDAFLGEYMARWKEGQRPHQMLEPLAKYWTIGRLATASQLVDYLRTLVTTDRSPPWFTSWYAAEVSAKRPVVSLAPSGPAPRPAPIPLPPPSHARPLTAKLFDVASTRHDELPAIPAPTPPRVTKPLAIALPAPTATVVASRPAPVQVPQAEVTTMAPPPFKKDFILAQDRALSPREVMAAGKRAGIPLTESYVGMVRRDADLKAKRAGKSPPKASNGVLHTNGVAHAPTTNGAGTPPSVKAVAHALDVLVAAGELDRTQAWKHLIHFTGAADE